MGVRFKICGLTKPREAGYLNEAGADYAGFVFYGPSKRHVTFEKAREIRGYLDPSIRTVAVLVSPDAGLVEEAQAEGFDIIQVHGDLGEEAYHALSVPLWRALNVKAEDGEGKILERLRGPDCGDKCAGILLDAANFGSGKTFDWEKAKNIRRYLGKKQWILSGGLDAGNVAEGIRLLSPDIVDVSSGVEGEEGKDKDKVFTFAERVRHYG